jgi:predicted MPP superfamily phosphohydrolase
VFLTGDILGGGRGSRRCVELLASVRPRLGSYAVAGNHEYGLSKNPFAHRPQLPAWEEAGVRFLKDECEVVSLPASQTRVALCGADYVTGGHPLLRRPNVEADFHILLIHRPPEPDDPLAERFSLAFAGHTHGGQIRLPGPRGWFTPHRVESTFVEGVHSWGRGQLAVSRGLGTTFLPLRLFARPEAVVYRLTSPAAAPALDVAVSGIHRTD